MCSRWESISPLFGVLLVAGLVGTASCQSTSAGEESDDRSDSTEQAARERPSDDEIASELPKGASAFEGIVTAGQPSRTQLESFGEHFGSIVNLRPHDEEGAWDEAALAEKLGATYVHIPISGSHDLTRENVARFDEILNEAERPILVHCSSSNRVGALFALRAHWVEGESVDQALRVGRQAGLTRLEEAVRKRINESNE